MIDPLDMKAMQEHSQALKSIRPVHVVECADQRGAQLLKEFHSMDERGRLTLLRMAQVMPKGPL